MTDEELDARFERFAADIKAGVKADIANSRAGLKAEISAEIKAESATTRRHFDVVAEALRTDIKVIADGHAALHQKLYVVTRFSAAIAPPRSPDRARRS
jgi:hypothetical protein